MMTRRELKSQADKIIEKLPEETSWENLMYSIYVRKKIDQGLQDVKAGKVRTTDEVRKGLGLIK